MIIDKRLVLVSGAIVFKETRGKKRWFLIKKEEEGRGWEIPKIMARKTESSARAAIRLMAEQGSMDARVLEEAGRAGGSTTVNGKAVPQRYLYYLMILQGGGEILGFDEFGWFEYAKAVRKIGSRREQLMLRQANQELKKWEREEKNKEQ